MAISVASSPLAVAQVASLGRWPDVEPSLERLRG